MENSKTKDIVKDLIDQFIAIRKKNGVTQGEIAEKSGCKQQVISRIENNTNIPRLDTFCAMLDSIGLKMDIKSKSESEDSNRESVINNIKEINPLGFNDVFDDMVIGNTELEEIEDKTNEDSIEEGNNDSLKCHMNICESYINTPIKELGLTVRSYICLKSQGINTVGDLTQQTKEKISNIRNISSRSIEEIASKLESMGLRFR